jgi:hypothetical protein
MLLANGKISPIQGWDLLMYIKYFHFAIRGMRNVHSFLNSMPRLHKRTYYFALWRICFDTIKAIQCSGDVALIVIVIASLFKFSSE